jgi:hypothetical protein
MITFFIIGVLAILLAIFLLNSKGDLIPFLGILIFLAGIIALLYSFLPILSLLN